MPKLKSHRGALNAFVRQRVVRLNVVALIEIISSLKSPPSKNVICVLRSGTLKQCDARLAERMLHGS